MFAGTFDNNGVTAGVLADNGGTVPTIALKPFRNNPAIDAGAQDLVSGLIGENDARGAGFARIVDIADVDNNRDIPDTQIDLGSYEVQELGASNEECDFTALRAENGKVVTVCL